jgi:hypothetical protein
MAIRGLCEEKLTHSLTGENDYGRNARVTLSPHSSGSSGVI